jgi:hypothetical protein
MKENTMKFIIISVFILAGFVMLWSMFFFESKYNSMDWIGKDAKDICEWENMTSQGYDNLGNVQCFDKQGVCHLRDVRPMLPKGTGLMC